MTTPTHGPGSGQLDLLAPATPFPGPAGMMDLLGEWVAQGWLRALDRMLAAFLLEQDPTADARLLLAAALASHQLGRGHVCLDLQATLDNSRFVLSLPPDGETGTALPRLPSDVLEGLQADDWRRALDASRLVESIDGSQPGRAIDDGDHRRAASAEAARPLVLHGNRLYLRRYWRYEQQVQAGIEARLAGNAARREALPTAVLRDALEALFPPSKPARTLPDAAEAPAGPATDWQKLACALMAGTAFGVITGGPGTGKTTTVVKLLALLQSLALTGERPAALRIRLAAPTGKAAARLNESIAATVLKLDLDHLAHGETVRRHIPVEVTTLHRLLGSRPDSRQFRHHAGNPLALDVLVVDEASMIDLEMMAAVLAALPAHARLLMLGDKDQLASVEAGAVLGELCARARTAHYLPQTAEWLQRVSGQPVDPALTDAQGRPLDQAVAMLRHSYRFDARSGIGQLAEAVNAGQPQWVMAVLAQGHHDLATSWLAPEGTGAGPAPGIPGPSGYAPRTQASAGALARLAVEGGDWPGDAAKPGSPQGYRHYLTLLRDRQPDLDADDSAFDAWARQVLEAHAQFQILCALRRGPWGVEGLNLTIARELARQGLIPAAQGWYLGRPVLVTRNDYGLGLMNGDIGITLARPVAGQGGRLAWSPRVAFAAGDGSQGIRWVLPSRLQAVESVFALTVHKSQGSEFAHAAMIVPDALSPMLTRELIYTGITRAKSWFTLALAQRRADATLAARTAVLRTAVERRVQRSSGLGQPGDDRD